VAFSRGCIDTTPNTQHSCHRCECEADQRGDGHDGKVDLHEDEESSGSGAGSEGVFSVGAGSSRLRISGTTLRSSSMLIAPERRTRCGVMVQSTIVEACCAPRVPSLMYTETDSPSASRAS